MSGNQKIYVYSSALEQGGYPKDCPFNSHRAGKTRQTIMSMGLLDGDDRCEVEPVVLDTGELERFHTADYLDALQRAEWGGLSPHEALLKGLGTPDCPMFGGMWNYTRLAAGGTIKAADAIISGDASLAFNPSGGFHHSMPGYAAGFCYLNDVVLAVMRLADAGMKVLFLDIDVHHCDGVQHGFYDREDVMTISLHESGRTLFPGTGFEDEMGAGGGLGYTVNIPLPVGTYDSAYKRAFREAALPLMRAFAPDVIVVEIGMDALAGDPLAHLHLTNNTHADILEEVMAFNKPILATGGGGYNVENTVRGWALAWSVLCGDQASHDDLMIGMGGVMLEPTEWSGGLRDRVLLTDGGRRAAIDAEIGITIEKIKGTLFALHGIAG